MPVIAIDMRMSGLSGIGTYVDNLARRIVSARGDWQFFLLGIKDAIRRTGCLDLPNVKVVELRSAIYSVSEQIDLSRRIPRQTDLFWAPHYNIPLIHKGKLMVTVHDVFHLAMPQFVKGLHKRLYARAMFGAIRLKADRVLCVSNFTRDELIRLVGIDRNRIDVINPGVDSGWFELQKDLAPRSKRYLLYVGNVKPHKNLSMLMDAFQSIMGRIPHELVIAGQVEGFLAGDSQAIDKAKKLSDRIVILGKIDDSDLRRYVVHADALVLPSLYEGFGLPPVEAMACGCPAIVSGVASLPEVCGDAAVYFNPYDPKDIAEKIVAVLEDEPLRDTLRERGRQRARTLSWDTTCSKTVDVIRDLMAC